MSTDTLNNMHGLQSANQQAEQQYTSWSVGGDKNRALTTVSTIISSSLGGQGANQVVTQAVSPYTAYAIGQYFKHNEALNQRDLEQTGEKGTRAEQGSASHLLAHGLLAAATSYATGQSPATITTTTIITMGAEALAPKLSQYLYGIEKVADLNTEQKQTISNVLGTVGLVAGVVTAQATGADSMNSMSAGQQVQNTVVNAEGNNGSVVLTIGGNTTLIKGEGAEIGIFVTSEQAFKDFSWENPTINWSEFDAGLIATSSKTIGYAL